MARKISQASPALSLNFFATGWFTNRNLLFAPYKGVGINVIEFKDALCDGINIEVTDRLQLARRPGFSIFCTQPLADGEVVNNFYSSRNLNGTVLPFVDTTRRLALFSPTAITTVLNKSTNAEGYITTIGNMTYISDGASADLTKYDGTNLTAWGLAAPTTVPVSTGLGFWYPNAHFSIGNSIQDTNGNIESVSAILVPNGGVASPTAFSNLALAGGVGAWAGSVGPGGTISETVTTPGHTNYLFFENWAGLAIPSTATIVGVTVSMSKQVTGGTAQDQSVKLVAGGSVAGFTEHASANPWNTSALTSVTYGSPTDNWGGLTPSQVNSGTGASGFGVAIAANVLSTTFYSLVQKGSSYTNRSTTTIYAFPNPVHAGNTLVVGVMRFDQTSIFSIRDTQGNPYTLAATAINGEIILQVFIAPVTTTGPNTITVTTDANSFNAVTTINAHEFSGILAVSPVEATGTNGVGPVSPFNSGTVTISHADDLLFACVWQNPYATQPAGWTSATQSIVTEIPDEGGGFTFQMATAFLAPGATGSYSPMWSNGSVGITVALKSAESATVTVESGSPTPPIITIYYKLPTGTGPGYSGNTEPIWPVNPGTSVNDGGIAWTNYGPAVTWYPLTNYPVPIVVLDTNGYLQLATSVVNPVQVWASGATYSNGNVVSFGGTFWIWTGGAGPNVAPNANYSVATTVGSVVTTVSSWAPANNPIITGSIPPVWNTTFGGTTVDGSYTWTNIGQGSPLAVTGYAYVYGFRTIYGHLTTSSPFSNNTGAILGPLNGGISSFAIVAGPPNVVTFQGNNNFQPGNVFTVAGLVSTAGTSLNGQVFTVVSATNSILFPLTATTQTGTTLVITAINNLAAGGGQSVTFTNLSHATWLNGLTFTTVSATATTFTITYTYSGGSYTITQDTGTVLLNGSWTANTLAGSTGGSVSDAGMALPRISQVTGNGTASPLCNSVATITGLSVSADIITFIASNNFQPGLWVTISGLTNAPYLNGQQVQVISVDKPVGTLNTQFQVFFQAPNSSFISDSGIATFNAVEIYRVSDGGGQYLFAGAVTNPLPASISTSWTFNDFVPDANLDILLTAPLGHQNDPPPGAPGSTITTQVGTVTAYWNGRLWMIVGNYVYFSAGPDCTNGVPEEAWPPGNRFQFAGPPQDLMVAPNGAGLLVYLADRVNVILGGPETISFYPDDFLTNFGVTSSNATFKDGSVIGQFLTQGRYVELIGKEQADTGEHIADYLAANFNSSKAYVTMHRNGLDVGMFISNGVDRIVRYGTNIGAWSVPAFPSFGAGALASIETSVGVYNLMLASPTGSTTSSNPQLGIARGYALLAWSGITNTGSTAITGGNIGSAPTPSITGFPPGTFVSPATIDNTNATLAHAAAAAAYTYYAGLIFTPLGTGVNLAASGNGANSHTYVAGNYSSTSSFDIPNTFGGIVLDGQGDSNAQFVFFSASTTTLESGSSITLINGAKAVNVIWVVGSSFTAVATSNMVGTILAQVSITLGGGTLTGQALAGIGGSSGAITIAAATAITVTGNAPGQASTGNYLYARDVNSWGDAGLFGKNNGVPYSNCNSVIGSITLSQLGGRLFPLEHVVGYFDAVGNLGTQGNGGPSYPNVWVLPNEINANTGIGFVQLPEVLPEPPVGQTNPSATILALRWPVNMVNSAQMSQLIHHLQVKIEFEPENAPNTLKALAFMEQENI